MKIYITEEERNEHNETESITIFIESNLVGAFEFFIDNYIVNDRALELHALYIGVFGGNVFHPALIRIEDGFVKSGYLPSVKVEDFLRELSKP